MLRHRQARPITRPNKRQRGGSFRDNMRAHARHGVVLRAPANSGEKLVAATVCAEIFESVKYARRRKLQIKSGHARNFPAMTTVSILALVSKKSLKCRQRSEPGSFVNPALAWQKDATETAARKSDIESRRQQAGASHRWRLQELKNG
jgi:hypothetical protein